MPADFTTLDWVILGGMAILAVIGLVRGISGEIGSLLGIATGLLAGFLLYGVAVSISAQVASAHDESVRKAVAIGIDGLFALVAGGVVRILVKKFVSFLIGKVLDCFLGLVAGLVKGVVITGVLTGLGVVKPGENSSGYFSAKSPVIRQIADWADAYAEGAAR
ncbi:MAG: CvpA family protein [Kiritimatiellae bacterium]|nr:CvpA family protein [Kiritimatiellia bacterium]